MILADVELPQVYLMPGDMHVGAEPCVVTTVLGSCISITIFAPRLKVGAICHCMLPKAPPAERDGVPGRYVDTAFQTLINKYDRLGLERRQLQVKLFGGADMFPVDRGPKSPKTVGEQNIDMARRMIQEHGLYLTTSDTGGSTGRKLLFWPHTGDVFIKKITPSETGLW